MNLRSLLAAIIILGTGIASGQLATGTPPFGSFGGGPFDTVNLGNLNVHFAVPVLNKAGRGTSFSYNLSYDSSVWTPVVSNGTTSWQPVNNWGWSVPTQVATGFLSYNATEVKLCPPLEGHPQWGSETSYSSFTYRDTFGITHAFPGTAYQYLGTCGSQQPILVATATDGSGYTLNFNLINPTVTFRGGKVALLPYQVPGTMTDANGNQITENSSGQFFDTLSSTIPVLTVAGAGTPASPTTFTYPAPSDGASSCNPITQCASYTMNYTQYTVATHFGFSGSATITEYGPLSNALVSSIALPDGSRYIFTYETTPGSCTPLQGTYSANCVTGRIASVTLPTGGEITYAYTGGPNSTGIYGDGSTAGLNRTLTPDGEWQYSRSLVNGTPGPGSTWKTTVIDPNSNQTVINFAEDGTTNSTTTIATYNFYETQRQVNQLINGTQTLLVASTRCYNSNYANCSTATVSSPITQTDAYSQLPNGSTRLSEVLYNGYGLVTDDKEYKYGVTLGAAPSSTYLVRETATSYASLGNGIVNKPSSVTVYDWTSGTSKTLASSTYTYDQGTPTATSGTPQHIAITGSRGNLTTATTSTSSTASLSRTFTYYDTGNPNVATGVNGAQTMYVYGSGSCGNSFSTTINEPLGLSRSTTWNCTGGVATLVIDENGKNVTSNYTASDFWRPSSVDDQLGNQTNYTYQPNPQYQFPTMVESTLSFNNGNSIVDNRIYMDGLGRPLDYQSLQAPGSSTLDTVSFTYDTNGRLYSTSMPCAGSFVATCPASPATTQTYDALNRPLTVTDGGGGQVTYKYVNNDVLQTISGGQTFQKQLEYDGLGRLTSVCEITSAAGSGSCGQSTSATGFLTKYTNDALGHLLTVTQNAQPGAIGGTQTRTYVYDMLGRLTSEANPESGTTTYVYDGTSCWSTPTKGLLTYKTDATGTTIMYSYDSLNRMIVKGSYGPNSDGYFSIYVYDSATVGGSPMQNTAGRLAEQVTGYGPSCTTVATCLASMTRVTDEGFSYTARGEMSDVYESTPNSGGYYHTNATYFANGALATLGGIPGQASWTYTPDGKGRPYSAIQGSSTNMVSSVTYNSADQPLVITLGLGDTDTYTYDPNTGRMTSYTFSVGATPITDVGRLWWNANGTLNEMSVTDGFNTGGTQDCHYGTPTIAGYDDLGRLASVVCTNSVGSNVWGQSFSYDAFGNITKSVPSGDTGISFAPGYNSANNRFQNGSTYDSNGNLLTDTFNTYTWNQDNKVLMLNSSGVKNYYDASGNLVDYWNCQHLLSPVGSIASMCGQNINQVRVPLPGGVKQLNYGSSVLFTHKDWLGSDRLISNRSTRTYYSDEAFAPFGEEYAAFGISNWPMNFTGDYSDLDSSGTKSILDTPNRELSPTQGRWISPDPAGRGATSLANPQSWNRYAYVLNNPLALVDPQGLDDENACGDDYCDGSGDAGNGGQPPPAPACDPSDPTCSPTNPPAPGCDPSDPSCNQPNPIATCNPGDWTCNPFANGCSDPYSAQCQSGAAALQTVQAGNDPCIFTQTDRYGNYNGNYNVNTTLNQQQCSQANGQWAPPGYNYWVDSYGTLQVAMFSQNACLAWQTGSTLLFGLNVGLTIPTGGTLAIALPFTALNLVVSQAACSLGGSSHW